MPLMQPYTHVDFDEDEDVVNNLLASLVLGNLNYQMKPVEAVQEAEKTVSEFIKARRRLWDELTREEKKD